MGLRRTLLSWLLVIGWGWLSQYDPGVMEGVVARRQGWGQLPPAPPQLAGYVATADCSELGQPLWLRAPSGEWELFMVADCPHNATVAGWMRYGNGKYPIIAEVDGATVERWHLPRGKGYLTQWTANPCGVLIPCQ